MVGVDLTIEMQCRWLDYIIRFTYWSSHTKMCYDWTHNWFQSYPIELIKVTAECKDGPSMANLFKKIVDCAEEKYEFRVNYFTTDCNGGSKKGHQILGKWHTWLLVPECWAHQVNSPWLRFCRLTTKSFSNSSNSLSEIISNGTRYCWTSNRFNWMD